MKFSRDACRTFQRMTIEEQKRMETDILAYFSVFCEKHGLHWYASGGTLLGAVRHKGFIPWDDDIDVMMPREDYNRFLALFVQEDTGPYSLADGSVNPDYPYPFAKVQNSRTILFEKDMLYGFNGVYIDVFPLDVLPDTPDKRNKLFSKLARLHDIATIRIKVNKSRGTELKTLFSNLVYPLLRLVKVASIRDRIDRIIATQSPKTGTNWGILTLGRHIRTNIFQREWFEEAVSLPFENISVRAPKEYAKVLEMHYGDYLQLPPENERTYSHGTVCYYRPDAHVQSTMTFGGPRP